MIELASPFIRQQVAFTRLPNNIGMNANYYENLDISSPKRTSHSNEGWEGFFPYYAGFPETFASRILDSAELPRRALVMDPWNGSGTTTFSACCLGLSSVGYDINPVMVVVAKARLLPSSEADSLLPLALETLHRVKSKGEVVAATDELFTWFDQSTGEQIRFLERGIRTLFVGTRTITPGGPCLSQISSLAATFYAALFGVCRVLGSRFKASNPTWIRKPRPDERLVSVHQDEIHRIFLETLESMALALDRRRRNPGESSCELDVVDATAKQRAGRFANFVLTSPPYCTRIDYSAATSIEQAILSPITGLSSRDLSRKMMGSTRVPTHVINPSRRWGQTCLEFLKDLKAHPSKASATYYYKTHLDYFQKMEKSLSAISSSLKKGGSALLVVQDSHYKEIYNDLPKITVEIAEAAGLMLQRKIDFHQKRSMAGIHPHTRGYREITGVTESVLCFERGG